MKKMVLAGLLAISLIAMSQQNASAWVNSKFGIGLNWSRQSGGNNFLWGAFHNGQPPGPDAFGTGGYQSVPSFAPSMPYHSSAPQYQAPAPMANYQYPAQQNPNAGSYFYNSPFQFASYPRESAFYYYYTPAPMYYYYGE
jgi:hypothetical protein